MLTYHTAIVYYVDISLRRLRHDNIAATPDADTPTCLASLTPLERGKRRACSTLRHAFRYARHWYYHIQKKPIREYAAATLSLRLLPRIYTVTLRIGISFLHNA